MMREGVELVGHSDARENGFPLWLDNPSIVLDNNLPQSGKDIDGSHRVARYRDRDGDRRSEPVYIAGKRFERWEATRGEHEYRAYKALKGSKYVSQLPRRVVSRDGEFWLLTSWERCHLREYLRDTSNGQAGIGGGMQPKQAATMLGELIAALTRIHRAGVAVCDLALENVLVTRALELLLADFDKWENPNTVVPAPPGRVAYRPHQKGCTASQLDLYALGVIGLELIFGPDWLWHQTADNHKPLPAHLPDSTWVNDLPAGYAKAVRYLLLAPRSDDSTEELLGYAQVALLQMNAKHDGPGTPPSGSHTPPRVEDWLPYERDVPPANPTADEPDEDRTHTGGHDDRERERVPRSSRWVATGFVAALAAVAFLVVPGLNLNGAARDRGRSTTTQTQSTTTPPTSTTSPSTTISSTPTVLTTIHRSPGPTKAQRQAAAQLAFFAYERGTNGNVENCKKNWKLPSSSPLAAQVTCTNFHNATIYTDYKTSAAMNSAYRSATHQGVPYTGAAGDCTTSWTNWYRTDVSGQYASGPIAFREDHGTGSLIWEYNDVPGENVIAEASGPIGTFGQICQAWYYNG